MRWTGHKSNSNLASLQSPNSKKVAGFVKTQLFLISEVFSWILRLPQAFFWSLSPSLFHFVLFLFEFSHWLLKKHHLHTVWPQPVWKKVRTSWQIPPQHQSKYQGGPESASIGIPPFQTQINLVNSKK